TLGPTSRIAFTVAPGTTSCGAPGLTPAPSTPLSGELDADTAGSTKIVDLGLNCLNAGGGQGNVILPGAVADGGISYLGVGSTTVVASAGTGNRNCTQGAGPGRHCANGNAGLGGGACATDADCGGVVGSCTLDPNCFFGPPVPVMSPPPTSSLTTCLL